MTQAPESEFFTEDGKAVADRVYVEKGWGRKGFSIERLCNELGELHTQLDSLKASNEAQINEIRVAIARMMPDRAHLLPKQGAASPSSTSPFAEMVRATSASHKAAMDQLRTGNSETRPTVKESLTTDASSLVKQLAVSLAQPGNCTWDEMAADVLREVATWLKREGIEAWAAECAHKLLEEADRD